MPGWPGYKKLLGMFCADADQQRFEGLRGTRAFLNILRNEWRQRLSDGGTFVPAAYDGGTSSDDHIWSEQSQEAGMSAEEVGFLTGVFRANLLEQYTTTLKNCACKTP